MTKYIYIVKGAVSDPSLYDDHRVKVGDPEWQFSDAPPGLRSCSNDYTDLYTGMYQEDKMCDEEVVFIPWFME